MFVDQFNPSGPSSHLARAAPSGSTSSSLGCTKRVLALLALTTLALLAGMNSSASAHFLTAERAERQAQKVAHEYADVGEYFDAGSCRTVTRHQRRCVIWSYMEETGLYCDAYTMVWFKWQGGSYRTTNNGWYRVACVYLTPDQADGNAPAPDDGWKWNWYGPLTGWPTIIG